MNDIWGYCPECGSKELHHEEGRHKQCANCHQEWFSDIDYSDVVRENLSALTNERDWLKHKSGCLDMERASQEILIAALQKYGCELDDWNDKLQNQLAASQAREAKLQSALMEISYGKVPKDEGEYADDSMRRFARDALALPTDDTALQQRLAQERERCAVHLDSLVGIPSSSEMQRAAAAIRSMK